MEVGKIYKFSELEKLLEEGESGIMLRVLDVKNNEFALMWVFQGNFSDAYQSGDGILFYEDGETHSADPDVEFKLDSIVDVIPT